MAEFSWLYGPTVYPFPEKPKRTAEERIRELRERDPEGLWLAIIAVAWDDLNSTYAREGISENFIWLRGQLKKRIARYRPQISDERWAEFISRHPDREIKIREKGRVVRTKFEHGYNFNYK